MKNIAITDHCSYKITKGSVTFQILDKVDVTHFKMSHYLAQLT